MAKRTTIKYGYKWMRFIFILFAFLIILGIIENPQNIIWDLLFLLICAILYFLFSISRRLQFDTQNFYIIRGSNEKAIHFSSIISIKKSSTKINGGRYWKMIYKDEFGSEHKCRYFFDFFYKEFHENVKKINPDVVIWTHPFFNH